MWSSIKGLFCKKEKKEKYEDNDISSAHEEAESEDIEPTSIEDIEIDETKDIYDEVADNIDIEPELLKSFIKVETNGNNLLNGRCIIRWETHIFKRRTGYTINVHGKRGYITDECQNNEWEAFTRARDLLCQGRYSKDAYESASWGIGQIMGFHYKRLGFESPAEMSEWIAKSEENGIRSIGMFIKSHAKLLQACKDLDFTKIAYYYNGKYYYRNKYDVKMKNEYDRLKAENVDVSTEGEPEISL